MRKLFAIIAVSAIALLVAPAEAQVGPGPTTPVTLAPAPAITPSALNAASVTLSSSAVARLTGIFASWNVPSTIAGCWLTAYNSASPTIGTAIVIGPFFLATSSAGNFAVPLSPTLGTASFTTALTVAVTTTPTGNTACNTSANNLFISGAQ